MPVVADIRTMLLPSGDVIPVLGQGTWHLGEDPRRRANEIAALRLGIDLGMTLIDTAEMYGYGMTEALVGDAIASRRDEVFLVSKVLPHNASRQGTIDACGRSLARMRTDRLDLYLLHWRGPIPLEETVGAFERLIKMGKIRHWGVSNFDVDDMKDLVDTAAGDAVETNQVLYNISRRGIEYDLMPLCRRSGLPIMAYSPIEQGRLLLHPGLATIAARHPDATPAQIALAWVLRHNDICAIPRAAASAHVRDNRAALDIRLTASDLADLDHWFPPPKSNQPLAVL